MYLITWFTTHLPTPEGWMAELAMLAKTHCQCLESENQRNRGILVNISFLTYLFTYELEMMSMSIVHLFSAESYSISTALSVLSNG